jgi:hypothetical protein
MQRTRSESHQGRAFALRCSPPANTGRAPTPRLLRSNVRGDLRTLAREARAIMGKRFRIDAARVQRSSHEPKPGVARDGFAWVRRKCTDERRKCCDVQSKCSDVRQCGGGPGHALRGATGSHCPSQSTSGCAAASFLRRCELARSTALSMRLLKWTTWCRRSSSFDRPYAAAVRATVSADECISFLGSGCV